jgi:hypothetical protein
MIKNKLPFKNLGFYVVIAKKRISGLYNTFMCLVCSQNIMIFLTLDYILNMNKLVLKHDHFNRNFQ